MKEGKDLAVGSGRGLLRDGAKKKSGGLRGSVGEGKKE